MERLPGKVLTMTDSFPFPSSTWERGKKACASQVYAVTGFTGPFQNEISRIAAISRLSGLFRPNFFPF